MDNSIREMEIKKQDKSSTFPMKNAYFYKIF